MKGDKIWAGALVGGIIGVSLDGQDKHCNLEIL